METRLLPTDKGWMKEGEVHVLEITGEVTMTFDWLEEASPILEVGMPGLTAEPCFCCFC